MIKPTPAEVRAELERVLGSASFAQAGRASEFLRFVVEQTLAGAKSKGYTIAIEVFGRPPDFDPQADPLVRVEAGRLRSRLAEYYETEGEPNPVRIGLPRGGYSASWEYAATEAPPIAEPASAERAAAPSLRRERWRPLVAALAIALLVTLGVTLWQWHELGRIRELLAERVLAGAGETPVVTVLPLENLSPEHTHMSSLAAALTEEIMLALGKLDVIVIAAEPRPTRELPAVAGRGYVLSGSVRGADGAERVRIALRLVDASTGEQLWSRAFDEPHEIEGLPALQAEVALAVLTVAAPYGPIFEAELARAERSADDLVLRDCEARYFDYRRTLGVAAFGRALECYQAVSLREPEQSAVWAGLGMLYLDDYGFRYGTTPSLAASLRLASEATERALALDRESRLGNMALARVQFFDGRRAELMRTIDRILEREADSAEARSYLGVMLALIGDPRGVELVDESLRMSPNQPSLVQVAYFDDYMRQGRWAEALTAAERIEMPQWFVGHMAVAAAAALCGDAKTAERARWRLLQLYPDFEAEAYSLFEQWHHDEVLRSAMVAGLTAAGFRLGDQPAEVDVPERVTD
jgi:TolB-like protein